MFAHEELAVDFQNRELFLKNNNNRTALASLIDSTLLKPDTTINKIEKLCEEAIQYGFRSVCVSPCFVSLARKLLDKTSIKVCTVVGFPNGAHSSATKMFETLHAIECGADEIDFVHNIGYVKNAQWKQLEAEYSGITKAASGKIVKIILETSLLTKDEILQCTTLAAQNGVHVIKTSTGFGSRGASLDDINTIQEALNNVTSRTQFKHGIKASGGIRSFDDALCMIQAGATRIGTSGGAAIVDGLTNTNSY